MLTKFLAATLVGSALLTAPALAQTSDNKSTTTTAQKAQSASETGHWQASKLIGMNVYNDKNEKIGDIKELMVDKPGKIELVAIAVGGFLGMGEHDVAVKFSDLKWVDEPVQSSSTSSSSSSRPAGTTGTSTTTRSDTKKTYPDHAVLNATKDQLKAMPQFSYNK